MPNQSQTIEWIPIDPKSLPHGNVLVTTKAKTVRILQIKFGKPKNSWMNDVGEPVYDIPLEDVIAWAKLPAPFDPNAS